MTGTPDVSKAAIFDAAKRYFGGTYQQGTSVFDWDRTETDTEFQWFMTQIAETFAGGSRLVINDGTIPFEFSQKGAGTDNNFTISGGKAFVGGRYIQVDDASFDYEELASTARNYIVKGKLSGISEVVALTTYDVSDAEKNFVTPDNYGFTQTIRMRMTSGALSGTEFDVDSNQSVTSFRVSGDLSTAAVDDEYILLPQELSMPADVDFYLVSWFEDISSVEDADLLETVSVTPDEEPCQRKELRWCILPDWTSYGTAGGDAVSGFLAVRIGNIVSVGTPILTAEIFPELDAADYGKTHIYDADFNATVLRNLAGEGEGFSHRLGVPTISAPVGSNTITIPPFIHRHENWELAQSPFSLYSTIDTTDDTTALTGPTMHAVWSTMSSNKFLKASGNPGGDHQYLLTTYLDVTEDIIRSFEMGSIPEKQGMSWYIDSTGDLFVNPGHVKYKDKLYQLSAVLNFDASVQANWFSGAEPTSDKWVYIYAMTLGVSDAVYVTVDEEPPKWDGTHPDAGSTAIAGFDGGFMYCIGMARWDDTGNVMLESNCINNKVTFPGGYEIENHTAIGSLGSWGDLSVQPPQGCSGFNYDIGLTDCGTAGVVSFRWSGNTNYLHDIPVTFNASTSFVIPREETNLADGTYQWQANATLFSGGTSPVLVIELRSFEFDPTYFPDSYRFDV